METTLSSSNRATIPKQVREYLKLKAGDRVMFFIQPDGTVVMRPNTLISKLRAGRLPKLDRSVSVEEMEVTIKAGATGQ